MSLSSVDLDPADGQAAVTNLFLRADQALARAKLTPPFLSHPQIDPRRSHRWFETVLAHRVCLIRAPAGYGKSRFASLLIAEARERGHPAAWVSFSGEDNEAAAQSYLIEAVRECTGSPALDNDGVSGGLTASRLAQAIQDAGQPILLVLDDVDHLTDPRLTACIEALVERAPGNLSLVLTARARPALRLEPVEMAGELLTLGVETLALTDAEAGALLADMGAPTDVRRTAALNALLMGWPAGLRAAAGELRRDLRTDQRDMGRFCSGWLDRYFSRGLSELSQAELDLLARAAVMPAVGGDLGLALAGEPGVEGLLAQLCRRGLFVDDRCSPPGWLQPHPALRAWLLQRLPAEERRSAHGRAARWLRENGRDAEAVDQALDAEDMETAADLAARGAIPMVERGRIDELVRWLERLPGTMIAARPSLRLARAWVSVLAAHDDAPAVIAAALEGGALSPDEAEALNILHLGLVRDELAEAMSRAEIWLSVHTGQGEPVFAERMLRALVARCAVRRGQFQLVQDMVRPVTLYAHRKQADLATAVAVAARAATYRAQGQLAEERRVLSAGVADAVAPSLAWAIIAASLSRSLYEHDALDEADALANAALPALERSCFQAAHGRALTVAIRTAAIHGRVDEAAALAERAELLGYERDLAVLKALSVVERARLGLTPNIDPETIVPRAREALAVEEPLSSAARAFALLSEARAYDAIMLGDRPRLTAVAASLLTLAANADDMELRARATLFNILPQLSGRCDKLVDIETVRFLNHAASAGFSRTLVDLLDVTGVRAVQNFSSEAYTAGSFLRLLKLADPSRRDARLEGGAAASPADEFSFLTEREIEILGALSAGDSNKEIARALNLTPETVKWHLKNILRKLRAGSREEAVQNASTLGLKMPQKPVDV